MYGAKTHCFLANCALQVGKRRQAPEGGSPKEREKVERAVVRFATRQEAHRALRDRQGAFCGGSALRLRVLQ